MKKILFSMVCLMMAGIQSVKAQVAIAALHHEGNVTIYSAASLQTAIDNSVAGDTIYLSEGIFGGFKVEKPIAIIGAGRTTMISSDITLGKANSTDSIAPGLLLSGLNIVQNVTFSSVIEGARITQCKIGGKCTFSNNSSVYSYDNIEILMSQIETLTPSPAVKGLSVVASKISSVPQDGYGEGSVTFLNCNINNVGNSNSTKNNSFMSCIINQLGGGVYTNCLYYLTNADAVIYNCYQQTFSLDNDLNCSLTDDNLRSARCFGPDGTLVGITGGEVKFTLVTPVAQVVEHSIEVDQAEKKLKVSLKLGNK